MPSYMVGAKDAFVPTQLYHPDFDAINGLLRVKQSQYDQGFNSIKSVYNSILNAPLTNRENQVVRQKYLADAQDKLKNLPSVDLSLQKNQIAAQQVFQPFVSDTDIISDMTKTRQLQGQIQFAENLRSSHKLEDQAQYWDTGVRYLQNGMNALHNAKRGDGSIQQLKDRNYVPYVDPVKYLDEAAKNDGLKIERETSTGQYKLTRINGDEAVPLFKTWALSHLSGNQQINDMFRVQGTTMYEEGVRSLTDRGMDEKTARSTLAENYLGDQLARYKSSMDGFRASADQLKKDALTARTLLADQPSQENLLLYKEKLEQLDQASKSATQYESLYNSLSNKQGKQYQDYYNSIVNNGEGFFAEHSRQNFIDNWAIGRASNSSVKYDLDPGFKLEEEMKKEMEILQFQKAMTDERVSHVVNGVAYDMNGRPLEGVGTQGQSSSTAAQTKQQDMDNPLYVGLNVYGSKGVSAYNRFVAAKESALNDYVDNGLNFIQGMSHNYGGDNVQTISNRFLQELKQQMTSGTVSGDPLIKQEYDKLQNAGVIPKGQAFGAHPSETYHSIKNYFSDILTQQVKTGQADPSMMGLATREERIEKQYGNLKHIEDTELAEIKRDPKFKDIIKDGRILDFGQYMNSKGIDLSDKALDRQYDDYVDASNRVTDPITATTPHLESREKYKQSYIKEVNHKFSDQYNNRINDFKTAFGRTSYAKDENAYIAPTIRFNTDRKGSEDRAQKIAQIAMSDDNFTEQNIDKNGITPVNIDQLVSQGADRKEVAGFLEFAQKNVADMISGVEVSKIGTNGNPMVRLIFDKQALDEYRNKKTGFFSDDTAKALGKGVEIELKNPRALDSQGLDLDFTPSSLDMLDLTLNGSARAPEILQKAGFDYTVEPSFDKKNLLVNFRFKRFDKGNLVPATYNRVIPTAGISLSEVENNLYSSAMDIYSGNNRAAIEYFRKNPQISTDQIKALEKQYNFSNN